MTPRQQKRIARLAELKTTALMLVVEHGIDGFSMHKLADRVGLTTGALYRYYDSRDELLVELQCDVLQGFLEYFDARLVAHQHSTALGELSCIITGFLSLAEVRPERFHLISHFSSQPQTIFDTEVVRPVFDEMKALLRLVASRIEAAQDAGDLSPGDPMRRTVVAWSMLQGITERKKLERFGEAAYLYEPLKQEALETLLRGFGATDLEDLCLIS